MLSIVKNESSTAAEDTEQPCERDVESLATLQPPHERADSEKDDFDLRSDDKRGCNEPEQDQNLAQTGPPAA